MRRRLVLVVLPVAGLLLAGCGSSSKSAGPSPSPLQTQSASPILVPQIGEITPAGGPNDVTTGKVITALQSFGRPVDVGAEVGKSAAITVRSPKLSQSNGSGGAPNNGSYVMFAVHIVNTGSQQFGGGAFAVLGGDGRTYEWVQSATDPLDSNQALNPGGQISGNVTFDAPTHGTLTYTANGSAVDKVEWHWQY